MTTKRYLAFLGPLLLLWSSVAAADAQGWVSDAWITTKTKIALLTTQAVAPSDVAVDTIAGRVSLYGKVPTAEAKRRAEEAVRAVAGVQAVRNLLQVVPPGREQAVEASDTAIRESLEKTLHADPALAPTAVAVTSVTNGVVLLGGSVPSSAEHLRAIETARRVPGVRRVESNVQAAPDDSRLDIWSRRELRQDGRGMLDVASDLWLTAEARLRLGADPRVPAPDIAVDCRDQQVTLFGEVASPGAKRAAEADVRAVSGVRSVHNELQVVSAAKRALVHARDNELEQKVYEAIYARAEMKRASISVSVKNGVARLSGTVPSQQHRLFAATAARAVPGVRAVEQDLRVSSITEERSASDLLQDLRPVLDGGFLSRYQLDRQLVEAAVA